MRESLHELYPDLLGFGKLYDKSKPIIVGVKPSYQMHRARCPKRGAQDYQVQCID